jgi:small ligand-binding sensory domain FIST
VIAAGSGLVIGKRPDEAAGEAARAALEASGVGRAEVALVFATADAYRQGGELLAAVRAATGAGSIVGCSGAGVLTERGEAEGVAAVAVMVLSSGDEPVVRACLVPGGDGLGADTGAELSRRTGMAGREDGCLLILPDAMNLSPDDLLSGLSVRLDPVAVVGGVAAGMPGFELYDRDVLHGAVTGLAVSAQPIVGIAQGCEPIGQPYVVTDAVANSIRSIAGRPPAHVLREAIESLPDYEERVPRAGVFAGLALDVGKSPLGRGDFTVRSLSGLDQESGGLTLAEPVFVGQTIQFQIRDPRAAHDDLEAMLARIHRELSGRTPAFGVYFNCAGRGQALYGVPHHDVTLIRERLGQWPLVGFFGNGEFAPVGGENYFHTYTGVLAVFPPPG